MRRLAQPAEEGDACAGRSRLRWSAQPHPCHL